MRSPTLLLLGASIAVAGCDHAKGPAAASSSTTAPPAQTAASTAPSTNERAAQAAAEAWLAEVDAGDYAKSWSDAAVLFKKAVDQPGWQKALDASRAPLGKLVSRKLTQAKYTTTVPGGPDGEYVVLTFETSFEKKQSAVETVTPMKDPDGAWRVSGYFIR